MCGIAGFYGFQNDELIKKISHQLAHRGPDGEGLYIDDVVTLLNRRLAIIDREGGNQPIYNEDRSIMIVYNGEIYNYRELQQSLVKKGHLLLTQSDTEVILHGYEEWGVDFFDQLNGMFAIAIYDKRGKKLVLARDHFGIKPLYYSLINHLKMPSLIFSSEITPIFQSGLIDKKPNDEIIYRYLRYRIHDDSRETFFSGIERLLPGETHIITPKGIEKKEYSSLRKDLKKNSSNSSISDKDIYVFKKKLLQAIKKRLISEVPVGTCLSGGLDSSTIVAAVNKFQREKDKKASSVGPIQKTFSAVFPGCRNDEEKYVHFLANKLSDSRLKVYKVMPKSKIFIKEMSDFVKIQEEPTISTGPYAQYKIMEKASGKVTVLLDGQGADEMMAGYLPYYLAYFSQLLVEKRWGKFLGEVFSAPDVIISYIKERISTDPEITALLSKDFVQEYQHVFFSPIRDNLKDRLSEDIFKNSLQALLRYEDKNAMHFSIEGRVPFLDCELLRFLFSLPDSAIIDKGWNKNILRQATAGFLPVEINKRRQKIGFTTPEQDWLRKLKKEIFAIFLSKSFSDRKYFNRKEILVAWQEYLDGKRTDSMVFWRLINLEIWFRIFFDRPSEKSTKKTEKQSSFQPEKKIGQVRYRRSLIKTDAFTKGDQYIEKIADYISKNLTSGNKKGLAIVSEKIVAISQGRSYFLWDIKPGFWASFLSRHVTRTPYGIGLGSPWTMQLAISEVGLPKILAASAASLLGKVLGIKGLFYRIAGPTVRSIDGPTEYSLFPSNVSAKLGPRNPQKVAENIKGAVENKVDNNKKRNFLGVVIIDANDIGRDVLGNSTGLADSLIASIMSDNPMGQSDEQTPIVIVSFE